MLLYRGKHKKREEKSPLLMSAVIFNKLHHHICDGEKGMSDETITDLATEIGGYLANEVDSKNHQEKVKRGEIPPLNECCYFQQASPSYLRWRAVHLQKQRSKEEFPWRQIELCAGKRDE
jgi:hypothetical protein